MVENVDWGERAKKGFLASGIDPSDRKGHKNDYIDLLQKIALQEVLELKGDEIILDFGCGSGRISYWIAPKVKKVVGLEITREMIDLAEKNRVAENVEFIVYDGVRFPVVPYPFDLILSVGVLQTMKEELLKRTLSGLAQYLKKDGRFYLIEQASDNPKIERPEVEQYLKAFKESKLECLRYYPIRSGRWWLLYLIRYGFIPKNWFSRIAHDELLKRRRERGRIHVYKDFLFLLKKE
ncbi:MAG: class I SAM-dependent methyltransferase [Thermodesulfobacteriota bacterium]